MKYPGDAYVGGLIDGEGCIGIGKRSPVRSSGGAHYRLTLTVGMTVKALPILEAIHEEFGGSLNMNRRATDRWEAAHSWNVGGPIAAAVLSRIVPHLHLKQEQAKLGIALEEMKKNLPFRSGGQKYHAWTEEARERCEIIRLRVMELNKKGPQPSCTRPPEGGTPFAWLVAGELRNINPDLLSEIGSPLSYKTFPKSGSMHNGVLYELPPLEHLTDAIGSSSSAADLLPTPTASLNEPAPWKEGVDWWLQSRATRNLEGVVTGNTPLLKTPTAQLAVNGGSQHPEKRKAGGHGPTLADELEHLFGYGDDPDTQSPWGRYAPAIERWEKVLDRAAPAPTEQEEGGKPRLSVRFEEWMLGFPAGWVTDVPGLSRKDQLRLLGNSCVPQQGALALRLLLERSGRKIS